METIYFFIILVVVIAIYAYCNIVAGKQDFVQCVEAGPTDTINAQKLKEYSFYDKHRVIKDNDGNKIDTSNMIRIVVKGNCMRPRNIESGAQLLVEKIDKQRSLSEQIKQNDILLIHLKDTGITKIRIFDKISDGSLVTYRYTDDGVRKDSSKPHSESSVIGIVRYRL